MEIWRKIRQVRSCIWILVFGSVPVHTLYRSHSLPLKPRYQAGRWIWALCTICMLPFFDLAAIQNEISNFGPARAMSTSAFLRLSVGSAACCAPIRGPIRGSKRCCSGLHHREQSSCEDISHRSSRWGGLLAGINVSGAGVVQVAPPDEMYKFTSHFAAARSDFYPRLKRPLIYRVYNLIMQ